MNKKVIFIIIWILLISLWWGIFYFKNNIFSPQNNFSVTTQKVLEKPFDDSYNLDAKNIAYFTENDTVNTIWASNPFYLWNKDYDILPWIDVYNKLKKDKITETLTITKELIEESEKLKTKLEESKGIFIDTIQEIKNLDPKYKKIANLNAKELLNSTWKESLFMANYKALENTSSPNPLAQSLFDYQKVLLSLKLSSSVLDDIGDYSSRVFVIYKIIEKDTNPVNKGILSKIDKDMEAIDSMDPEIQSINAKIFKINTILKQIETWDYLLTKALYNHIKTEFPKVENSVKDLHTNEILNDENIQFIKDYSVVFANNIRQIGEKIDNYPTSKLFLQKIDKKESFLIKKTYAVSDDDLAWAYNIVSKNSDSSNFTSDIKSVAKTTWNWVKTVGNAVTTTVWVGLDTVSAWTKSIFDVLHGKINWNTNWEITDEIKNNFIQIKSNYDKGISGATVFKTAWEYLEWSENYTAGKVEWWVISLIWTWYTSWWLAWVTKITVWMFTGFGKWIYKLADKQATTGQLAEWLLDVGLSFIWGSKVIAKWSQVFVWTKEWGKLFWNWAKNLLTNMVNTVEKKWLKNVTTDILKNSKLTPSQVTELIKTSLEMEWKEAIATQIATISKELDAKFVDLLKDWMKTILKNAKDGGAQSYKEFVKESFENSIKGYKDSLIKVLWESYIDYIDNLVASKVDDYIKATIRTYVESGVFDGKYKYSYVIPDSNYIVNLELNIEDWAITWWTDFKWQEKSMTFFLKGDINWSVDEKWLLSGKWKGEAWLNGPSSEFDLFGMKWGNVKKCIDNLKVVWNGDIIGKIIETNLEIWFVWRVKPEPGSTFWCEPVKQEAWQALDGKSKIILKKE